MKILGIVLISTLLMISFPLSLEHGIGYEVLGPLKLGEKNVSLEVTSSQYDNTNNSNREIQFSLFDADNSVTIKDVTYEITAYKRDTLLFQDTFKASNGIFTFDLLSDDSEDVKIKKSEPSGFLETIIGIKNEVTEIRSSLFNTGGLYNFKVKILTAGSFSDKLDSPLEYNVGLSIPQQTFHDIHDPNFGTQRISIITYYDEIDNFQYDPENKALMFSMPFVWDEENINQTSVVHEELILPKTFGDLLTSEYVVIINGKKVPDRAISIDDFSETRRTLHVVLNQNDLRYLSQDGPGGKMEFIIKPKDGSPLSTVTANGQFRITLDWLPTEIRSGSTIQFRFNVTDVFLKNRPVAVDYELKLTHQDDVLYSFEGVSSGSKDEINEIKVNIPENVVGVVNIQFNNLKGNSLAKANIPIVVNKPDTESSLYIPEWVRNNAKWWSEGKIDDDTFLDGIQFMLKRGIIDVPLPAEKERVTGKIPEWVRNNAKWWSEGKIDDKTFSNGLQYMIKGGLIVI